MFAIFRKFVIAAGAAATIGAGALVPRPASADTTSTLLSAAAVIGGIVLYNNYERKKQAADTVVGYTGNGGTVYADGRVVMPNGQSYYPNSNGQYSYNGYGQNYGYPTGQNYGYGYPTGQNYGYTGQYGTYNGQYNQSYSNGQPTYTYTGKNGRANNGAYGQWNSGRGGNTAARTNDGRRDRDDH